MRKFKLLLSGLLFASLLQAQETFPVNGVADKREGCYAFTNATIVKDAQTTLTNATLVIRDGKIIAIGAAGLAIPKDAVVIDCKDKYIYPSFVDIYTDYGVAPATATTALAEEVLAVAEDLVIRPLSSLQTQKALIAGTRPAA
jgi:imidazolonepropionase-like amidohydrolase